MSGRARSKYVADFETTTDPEDCRVWAWGIVNIDTAETTDDVTVGQDLASFLDLISKKSNIIYFHNLAFDGRFIIDYLLRNGFRYVPETPRRNEFSTLISNMGKFYSFTVHWGNGRRTEFRDSLKKLPMSAENVAEAFGLPVAKGTIDYHSPRPAGHVITPEEREYIALDVLIIALALRVQLSQGAVKLTVGSDALAEFKSLLPAKQFQRLFPILPESMDTEIRSAYRGGFTYADPRFSKQLTRDGKVYDVNSLYPSVMYDRLLPYGQPEYVDGFPSPTETRPLFIVSVTFTAKLKPNHIPCIQVKGSFRFNAVEYQTEISDPVTLTCTNIDLALWEQHYDMDILAYNGGWRFMAAKGVFTKYIDKWMEVKKNSDGGMRALSKLFLNSLYGKFATNPNITGKYPVLENNVVKLKLGPEETRDPVYTAMGVFITAYARDVTIRAAQDNYDTFAYADTDSLHLLVDEHPAGLDIDPKKLGAWKHEYDFDQALYIRPKAYLEHKTPEYQLNKKGEIVPYEVHIAGLPERVAKDLTFSDIVDGTVFRDKLVPKSVPGGIVLQDVGFKLNM